MDFASQTEEVDTNVLFFKKAHKWTGVRAPFSPAGGGSRLAPGLYRGVEVFAS